MVNKVLTIGGIRPVAPRLFPRLPGNFDRVGRQAAPTGPLALVNSITFTRI